MFCDLGEVASCRTPSVGLSSSLPLVTRAVGSRGAPCVGCGPTRCGRADYCGRTCRLGWPLAQLAARALLCDNYWPAGGWVQVLG